MLAAALIALLLQLAWQSSPIFPVDDAYISFRYARNLASGAGLVFNLGEPIEGYSNFLFLLLVALLDRLGATPPTAASWINIASTAAIVGFLLFADRRLRTPIGLAAATVLIFVAHGSTYANALSGLEAPLTAAVLLGAALAIEKRRAAAAGVGTLLLSLARPEGAPLALLLWIVAWIEAAPAVRRRLIRWMALSLAGCLAYSAFRWLYFGDLIPNSISAKSGVPLIDLVRNSLPYYRRFLGTVWPLLPLAFVGAFKRRINSPERSWALPAALAAVGGLPLLTASGDPYFLLQRYLFPALPLLLLLAQRGAHHLFLTITGHRRSRAAVLTSIIALLSIELVSATRPVGLATPVLPSTSRSQETRLRHGLSALFAADRDPHQFPTSFRGAAHHVMAEWFREHVDPASSLATMEIGTLPYYSGVRVLDLFGLVDRTIARSPGRPGGKVDLDYVFEAQPDYIVWPAGDPCLRSPNGLLSDRRLLLHYELRQMFSQWGNWRLLFERRSGERRVASGLRAEVSAGRLRFLMIEGSASTQELEESPLASIETGPNQADTLEWNDRLRRSALEVTSAEPGMVRLMQQCQDQWRPWVLHRAVPAETRAGLAFRLRIPPAATLEFTLQTPPDPSTAPRHEIWVLAGAAAPRLLFSHPPIAASDPTNQGWQDFRVDLDELNGQEVDLVLVAVSAPDAPEEIRGHWRDPLLLGATTGDS